MKDLTVAFHASNFKRKKWGVGVDGITERKISTSESDYCDYQHSRASLTRLI